MQNITVLFRPTLAEQDELDACKKVFPITYQRAAIPKDSLVIPRYSALPFYKEMENDVLLLGSQLLNSHVQHAYVADLKNWYFDLKDVTPKTWFRLQDVPKDGGPFVLKGATNSKKHQWHTHMFAADWKAAGEVHSRLMEDTYISYQDIYIREYVSLNTYGKGVTGLPITEEYRFFVLDGVVVSKAFYWSEHVDYLALRGIHPDVNSVPEDFCRNIIDKVSPHIRFFVFDVAKTETGSWILIELNDGQMSGLSENDPNVLYNNMKNILTS